MFYQLAFKQNPNENMHWTEKAWLKRASAKLSLPVMWALCEKKVSTT